MNNTDVEALKNCPFCGHGANMRKTENGRYATDISTRGLYFGAWIIECENCRCEMETGNGKPNTKHLAVQMWNKRA